MSKKKTPVARPGSDRGSRPTDDEVFGKPKRRKAPRSVPGVGERFPLDTDSVRTHERLRELAETLKARDAERVAAEESTAEVLREVRKLIGGAKLRAYLNSHLGDRAEVYAPDPTPPRSGRTPNPGESVAWIVAVLRARLALLEPAEVETWARCWNGALDSLERSLREG